MSKRVESVQGFGFVVLLPLAIVSNSVVPSAGMPAWLQVVADWSPVGAATSALRDLFGDPNPSAPVHAWPKQHPVAAALGWSVAILVVSCPLAARLFRRKTVD
ncbi:MAG: ABC transporter permease [Actinomycetota bacterium]|nr:ABC transporter permease [Actinomycetota bacterium]